MRNFINLVDIDKKELRKIIDHAKSQKGKGSNIDLGNSLAGKTLVMIFENWGRLVSPGKFRLVTACRGSKVTS